MSVSSASRVLPPFFSVALLGAGLWASASCGSSAAPGAGLGDSRTLPAPLDAASGTDARAVPDGVHPASSEAGAGDSGSHPVSNADASTSASGAGASDSGMAPTCPASAASGDEFGLFADSYGIGVSGFGFSGLLEISQALACTGSSSLHHAANQYDGFGISTSPLSAGALEARVYVSRDSDWTISAQPSGQDDGHCFRLPNSTLCGQFDPKCGANQDASSCILHFTKGFQKVRLSIPSTTPQVGVVMFEQQSAAPTPTDIYVDDLRLVRR